MATLQIRDVPADLHNTVRTRAAAEGLSISDYLLREIKRGAERPTRSEILTRIATREPVEIPDLAQTIREERDRLG